MAYIGKQPTIGNFQVCDAISVVNGQAAYTMQVSSVNVVPETANHMIVSLNGIIQKPGSSFTVSGSTITFASNLVTGDVIDFIHILGSVLDLGVPSDDTVSTAKISANAVTAAKFNADVISGQTALATAPADTDEFLVSDAGVLKRIDYSLIKGGGMFEKLITTTISSATSNITFDNTYLTTAHRDYRVVFTGMKPATDNKRFTMVISDDNGSSFKAGSDYEYRMKEMQQGNSGFGQNDSASNNKFELTVDGDGNGTGEALHGHIDIFDPLNQNSDSQFFSWQADLVYFDSDGDNNYVFGNGYYKSSGTESTVFNAIKFAYASGNILIGSATLYGRKI